MKQTLNQATLTFLAVLTISFLGIFSCGSPSQKNPNSSTDVSNAKEDLNKAQNNYDAELEKYKNETAMKLDANDSLISKIKRDAENDKREDKEKQKEEIAAIEKNNSEMKQKLAEYKNDGNNTWQAFKDGFNRDMDKLSQSINDLTSRN